MSASTTPTVSPCSVSATARFEVTDDLPTPPLPEAIAYTRVSESGLANGISRSACPPRSCWRRAARCSSLITPRRTSTLVTPSTDAHAWRVSRSRVDFNGHPETVSRIVTATAPASSTDRSPTMPSSVIGLWISGSSTPESASSSASRVGAAMPATLTASYLPPSGPVGASAGGTDAGGFFRLPLDLAVPLGGSPGSARISSRNSSSSSRSSERT